MLPTSQAQGVEGDPSLVGLTGLEVLDALVDECAAADLKVVLARHGTTAGSAPVLWYDSSVDEAQWIADWEQLTDRYRGDTTVVGMDLHNEPRAQATWGTGSATTDWQHAAQRAGNAILAINPGTADLGAGHRGVGRPSLLARWATRRGDG